MGMLPEERLAVACLSYHRALAAARGRSTPATWRALVTAAKNLASARRDRKMAGERTGLRAAPPVRTSFAPVVSLRLRMFRDHSRELWAQVNREWERSQVLTACASRIVERSRALLASRATGSQAW